MNTPSSMALELTFDPYAPLPARRGLFVDAAFVAFLLLIFVTFKPFAVRDVAALSLGDNGTGAGDVWRQVCYLVTFTALVLAAFQSLSTRIVSVMPPLLALLLGWCLLTSLWAQSPDVTTRRAGLEIVIAMSAMLGVHALGPERALSLLRWVLAGVLLVNFASILLVHQAVHLPDESDRQLIGNWRGLHFHKNIAGAISAITAILFFFRALETKRLVHWLIVVAAVFFTVMTRSKTSLALFPIALLSGVLFRFTRPRSLERWLVLTAIALVAGLGALALATQLPVIERYLADPTELTGRVAIWQAQFAFVRDHPMLGAGFGSFSNTGALSPLYHYVADKWVWGEAHGHNAYLQMLVTIGGIGFALAVLAFVVQPALAFRRLGSRSERMFYAPLFAIFVFELFHNFSESDFLEGDGPAWVTFLLMLACLHAGRHRPVGVAATLAPERQAP
jgi:exopolysaccharide production protein ExoQ